MLEPEKWTSPQRILVILAHPDDPEFFCGATLARWAAAGHPVRYCLLCCGDKGWNPATPPGTASEQLCAMRREEQLRAARVIGAGEVEFLDYQDGYLWPDLALRRDIVRVIRRIKPDVLVTCDPQNLFATYGLNHPDHRAAGEAVLDAVFPASGNPFYFPELLDEGLQPHTPREVWITLTNQANVVVDVTDQWETRIRAILEHTSQVQDKDGLVQRQRERMVAGSDSQNPRYEERFRVVKYEQPTENADPR
jgi:LmbE family N-acetylglucosaminyl deacetylase